MLGSHFDLNDVIANKAASEDASFANERNTMAGAEIARPAFKCPVCDEVMRVCDERDLNEFGGLDVKLHKLECDSCGMLTGRVFHPSIGYDSHLVR